jgi:hypothetical protein
MRHQELEVLDELDELDRLGKVVTSEFPYRREIRLGEGEVA